MGTSTARELTCDRPASYPGGVMYSHPLALKKPGISTGLMSLKAREEFNFYLTKKTINSGINYFAALISALFISLFRVVLSSIRYFAAKRRRLYLFFTDKTK